jgi:nitrous oxide reductase accessory protein NosL
MKRVIFFALILLLLSSSSLLAAVQAEQQQYPSCSYCGMDRVKFAQSRMLIEYVDGQSVATCSLHCAALELALSIDKTPRRILVADFHSKQLIDAETAVWVVGGDQGGVMSSRGKWAFAERPGAEEFVANHGGESADFEQVMEAAYADMYRDTLRIRKMRQMKMKEMSQQHSHAGQQ